MFIRKAHARDFSLVGIIDLHDVLVDSNVVNNET